MSSIARLWQWIFAWILGLFRRPSVAAKTYLTVRQIHGDLFPAKIPVNCLVELLDDDPYAAALNCPCGCGETIELMLMEGVQPRWDITIDTNNRPTLHPSVWRKTGCRSHFWIHGGEIVWCKQ